MLPGNTEFCRFFTFINGQWGRADLDFQCKSLTYLSDPARDYRGWWILGRNGEVQEISNSGVRREQIAGAGLNAGAPYGHVGAIKEIDGALYVCGHGRQLYRRTENGWASLSDGILTHDTARGFFDIDGLDGNSLYTVGWNGEIFFHDGRAWQQDASPTNAHLAGVKCLPDGKVWICGNRGVVLFGTFGDWHRVDSNGFDDNWYSIELFSGTPYLAGNNLLAKVENGRIIPVDTGLGRKVTTHRLHAREGTLWSIGEEDILACDGRTWTPLVHPDNG
ncbi:hypothetical protein L3V18_17855 [Lysobacter sp. TLK-CK17T]|uniref:Uncharacterized protein n=2 Tax=Marilutibacter chinensis TaxID=2912247 RepID=A0ABS9HXL9_9GAMM|nr:hypothetical protein [Lysobacter chinensis]